MEHQMMGTWMDTELGQVQLTVGSNGKWYAVRPNSKSYTRVPKPEASKALEGKYEFQRKISERVWKDDEKRRKAFLADSVVKRKAEKEELEAKRRAERESNPSVF